ncbi:MAG: ribosome small subunit-dependent GTPase A [Clostridiales bacterium]|nr:ribosome small subunit-dependent GTPase A [Clostridiales bacterium]
MEQEKTGLILKGIGGFYYVKAGDTVYECKARGVFRRNAITPLVGDHVKLLIEENQSPVIAEILPRKNSLIRPPMANLDQLVLVAATCDPAPSTLVIDKIIAAAEDKGISPILVISKIDLEQAQWLRDIYEPIGFPVVLVSSATGEGVEQVKELLRGKITAFTGNSGVGKSSLLNQIDRRFCLETGEISRKLGRGRHTTRQVELFPLEGGGYVADTPGFSAIQMERYDVVHKEQLPYCFREFEPFLDQCRFPSCSHTCEKGCAVLEAVREGKISRSRHESYVALYQEVKDWKEWKK